MALVNVGEKALLAIKETGQLQRAGKTKAPAKKVLDEETYSEDLEKIIARDFFPDLAKLKAQKEYMEAMEKNDLVKMRELALKYASTGGDRHKTDTPATYGEATPATFETPEVGSTQSPPSVRSRQGSNKDTTTNPERPHLSRRRDEEEEEGGGTGPEKKKSDSSLTLDKYLTKHTSEDNASFGDIMAVSEEKHRHKHSWLYEAEAEHHQKQKEILELKGHEERLAIKAAPGSSVNTWDYQVKNALMYVPDGVAASSEEKIKKQKEVEVVHHNTRLTSDPFRNVHEKTKQGQAAANQVIRNKGRIGADGKEVLPMESPKVMGYGFVGTPSPAPGVNESPLMTWGEIEGTPFRLDGSDTPMRHSGPGPAFKIPGVPKRDRLGHLMVEEVTKKHRAKKQEALKRVAESLVSPSPKRYSSLGSVERLRTLSPAAQKLVSKKLSRGSTDKALRASYTPSPSHRGASGDKTPGLTPKSTRSSTPGRTPTLTPGRTPGNTPGRTSGRTPGRTPSKTCDYTAADSSTITDNLLNLPKRNSRAKATDFF